MSLGILEDNPALGIIWGRDNTDPTDPTNPGTDPGTDTNPTNVDIGDIDVRAITCNVQNTPDLSHENVKKCGKLTSGKFQIGGFQELGEAGKDRADVLAGLGDAYGMTAHGNINVQTQIAYLKDRFRLGDGGYVQCVPGGQPYPNPERGFVWAEVKPEKGPQFLFVVTHMVNKAWNDVPDNHKKLRKANWNKHYNEMSNWLNARVDALPIVLVGDFNRVTFPLPMRNATVLAGSNGIDKIIASVPTGFRIRGDETFTIATPSDHDALGRQFNLERKRPS